jgi:hypothetical protein
MKKLVTFYKIWQITKARGHQALVQIFIRFSPSVVIAFNDAYTSNKLSVIKTKGVITCISKENKPKQLVNTCRPITLLNT